MMDKRSLTGNLSKSLLVLSVMSIFTTANAQGLQDEYGLTLDSNHVIGSQPATVAQPPLMSPLSRTSARSSSSNWYIQSKETIRYCEWWDGEIPRIAPIDSSIQIEARRPGRHCKLWTEYPKYTYGTAHVYKGNDNVLDKPVVVVQPYHVSIDSSGYTQQNFYNDVNSGGLMSSLRNAGYDVILYRYHNQNGGIAYNAKGIQLLLEKINSYSSVTSSSFVGLSMGGVVARYALTELEDQGKLDKVSTYISYDAPHLGANFPRTIIDNTKHLLSKVDSRLCGLSGKCREARRELQAILKKLDTKTFRELIINSPSGSSDRYALLSKLRSLGHLNTIPTLAITNGAKSKTQGASSRKLTTHFKLHRKWYNGGSKYYKIYTNPSLDNTAGGYADFYLVFSNLIASQAHPITPYVTVGQKHSFVSTNSALAGNESNFTEVASYPSNNEAHMTLTYSKARKIRQWLDANQY